ncbi:hypothetical protein D3C74_127800 [compost metagenome]
MKKTPLALLIACLATAVIPMPWWIRFPISLILLTTAIAYIVTDNKKEHKQ